MSAEKKVIGVPPELVEGRDAATTLRRVTFEEVNDPRSVWPRGKWQASNA